MTSATARTEDLAYTLVTLALCGIHATTSTDSIGRADTGNAATVTVTGDADILRRAEDALDSTDPWHRWTKTGDVVTNAIGTVRVIAQRTH
jgi:hypothetical protein